MFLIQTLVCVITLILHIQVRIGKDPDGTGFLIQLGLKCQKNLCHGTIVVPNLEVGPKVEKILKGT